MADTPGPEPLSAEALNDRGVSLARAGKIDEAIECYRHAIALRPGYALALNNLGLALQEVGRFDDAAAAHSQAIASAPSDADGFNSLATALGHMGRLDQAAENYRRALALRPDHAEALVNLGNLLRGAGRLDEAATLQRRAVALAPDAAEVLNHLGMTLYERREFAEAIGCFRRAVALQPDHTSAHVNLAMALLAIGDIERGAEEYEWRWRGYRWSRPPSLPVPLWDGRPLAGTLLLWPEQGLGDTIQFVRYAPLLRTRVERIVLACPAPLVRLMRTAPGLDAVVAPGEPTPPIHAWLPLMSAMHRLGTRLETIPAPVPYLAAAPAEIARLTPALSGGGLRVGLAWSGNPRHSNDRRRSLPATLLRPLLDVAGASFYSLQVGPGATDIAAAGLAGPIGDLAALLHDFSDTAAAMNQLDLIITVDTALAHLAGALGRRCWVLLASSADWRWMQRRSDSPWYPTIRLFRQAALGAWEPVIADVADELRRLVPP